VKIFVRKKSCLLVLTLMMRLYFFNQLFFIWFRKDILFTFYVCQQIPHQQIKILDHPDLQDGFDNTWSSILIAKILKEETATQGIDLLITFDSYGISGHQNHRDVHNGIW
ncbi:N-acetylglucosaminyl-phosphatidylinositol de-n-acetylase protein, partial [Thalictrum thalictroides]